MTSAEILDCRGSDAADLERIRRDQARQLQSMSVELARLQSIIKISQRPAAVNRTSPRRSCVQRRRGAGRPAGRPAARACSSGRSDPDLADLPRPRNGVQA